jgi:hypothetical protein
MKKSILFIFLGFLFFFPQYLLAIDFFSGIEQIAESFAPRLKNKSTTIGLIKDKKTGSRLRLSDALADEISVTLKNKGVDIVITEQKLDKTDKNKFSSGLMRAKVLIVGSFQKWGRNFVVTIQAVDTGSGKVIAGKTVRIDASDIPKDMLEPVLKMDSIIGQGTASISYQCYPDEKPCPPKTELRRRAIDAAKMMAMEDLATKTGVSLNAVNQVVSGRGGKKVINSKTSGQLRNLKFQEPLFGKDEVIVKLNAEIFSI